MGNCCDRLTNRNAYDDGDSERRPLLNGGSRSVDVGGATSPGGVKPEVGSGAGASLESGEKKNDEQSALNRILQTTADQVIDVGALDSRGLEQRDYLDRARQYSARLSLSVKPSPLLTQPANLLSQHLTRFPAPSGSSSSSSASVGAVLAAPAPKDDDLRFVTVTALRCAEANKALDVVHYEDLVVPFGV